jgi:hypothetical protein
VQQAQKYALEALLLVDRLFWPCLILLLLEPTVPV